MSSETGMTTKTGVSRRGFIKGALTAATATIGVAALSACDTEDTSGGTTGQSFLPETWDAETDILVVGCGGAGISAGITAKTENLGDVLVLEAAPAGFEGGNTRVSAQVIFIPDSVDGAITYQRNLNAALKVEETLLQAWAENICQNLDWLQSLEIEANETNFFSPEWPDVEGSEHCRCYLVGEGMGNEQLWTALADVASSEGVSIQNDTRVRELIVNPLTKEVIGVKAEVADGTIKSYKARKGVLLSCGGFENNRDMIQNYYQIGYYETYPMGTPYNRGDGILMAQSVGAELWHMNNFANSGFGIKQGGNDVDSIFQPVWPHKDYIFVASDGRRFMYEEMISLARHGKYLYNGKSTNLRQPVPLYAIFGSKTFDGADCIAPGYFCGWLPLMNQIIGTTNQDFLDADVIVKGETAEELAGKIGVDAATLAETISTYNAYAATGEDAEFNRGTDVYSAFNYGAMGDAAHGGATDVEKDTNLKPSIAAFELEALQAPYYAVQIHIQTLNTQGGPKRGTKGEVLDTKGEPIPRLYAAGELGAIYSYNYNGGGNVSESMSSGRLAARSIAGLTPWDE